MPTGYYLACFETHRYVWIGTIGDTTSAAAAAAAADPDLVSSFCLVHRGKALVVVSETLEIVGEGREWAL